MPSGPVLSESDKKKISKRLKDLCEQYWISYGFKKTSIKELCSGARISIGTFYTLYPKKEDLFFETIEDIQSRLTAKVLDINKSNPTKEGFAKSMKEICREYASKPFLYNVNTPDFQSFVTKLPDEAMAKIKFDSIAFFEKAVQLAKLNLNVDEYKAYGILSALLSTINAKEMLSVTCDYFEIYDFMVDNLIKSIFK